MEPNKEKSNLTSESLQHASKQQESNQGKDAHKSSMPSSLIDASNDLNFESSATSSSNLNLASVVPSTNDPKKPTAPKTRSLTSPVTSATGQPTQTGVSDKTGQSPSNPEDNEHQIPDQQQQQQQNSMKSQLIKQQQLQVQMQSKLLQSKSKSAPQDQKKSSSTSSKSTSSTNQMPSAPIHSQTAAIAIPSQKPIQAPVQTTSTQQHLDVLCPAVKRMGYTSNPKETIGEGAFSRVYRARSVKITDKDIAVKIVRVDDPNIPQAWKDHSMKRELKILKKVKHPNVITVYDVIKTRTRIYIFMDLAVTSVASHLEATEEPASEQTAKSWFGGISNAIAYLHQCEIAHRDIKNENILIDSQGNAKLTDFGFACFTYDKVKKSEILAKTSCGTKAYVAPEVFSPPYNPKLADVWSLGVCLYETVTLLQPFRDDLPTAMFVKRQLEKGLSISTKIREKLSEALFDLLRKMIEPNVNKRLRSEAVLIHPWIRVQRPN